MCLKLKKSVVFEFRLLHLIKSHAHWLKQKRIFSLVYLHIKNVYILLQELASERSWEVPLLDVTFGSVVLSSDGWSLPFLRTIRRRVTSVFPEDNRTRMLLSSCVRTVMLSTPSHAVLSSPIRSPVSPGSYYVRGVSNRLCTQSR